MNLTTAGGKVKDSELYYALWHIVSVLIILPTIIGNTLIILSIYKCRRLRCNMHVLVGNLAVSDLIVGAALLPLDMFTDIFDVKASSKYICLSICAVYVLSLGSSCLNLLLISMERYVAIVYPLKVKYLLTKRFMSGVIGFVWLITIATATSPLYGANLLANATFECRVEKVWTQEYRTMINWQLILSLIANITFYSHVVLIALRKSRREINSAGNNLNIHKTSIKDIHQLITMVIVLGTFMLCWLPFACMAFVVTFWETPYHHFVKRCALIPGLINSAVNWIIYGYRKQEFRQAFTAIIRCRPMVERRTFSSTTVFHVNSNCLNSSP